MDNSAIAIIQARMSSTRLPGKVLLPLAEKPMIHQIVDRVKSCLNVSKVVVATSLEESDNPLANYCENNSIEYFRGSLSNVLNRYTTILTKFKFKYCVRITGDCPLIHPPFIDAQIEALQKYSGDLIWKKGSSTVLEGQSVISRKALFHIADKSKDPDDLEHVGSKYFLSNKEEFKYVKLEIPNHYYSYNYRLTVDEQKDYEFMKYIFNNKWSGNQIKLLDVINLLKKLNNKYIVNKDIQMSKINQSLIRKRKSFKPDTIGSYVWSGK